MMKISLLLKKFTNFTGQITREFLELRMQNVRVLFSYEHKHIEEF